MKHGIFYGILIIICYVLQTTLFIRGGIVSAVPNLLLIVTVSAGLLHGNRFGMAVGAVSGLALDLFQGRMFGFYALLLLLAGYAAGFFWKVYFEKAARVPALIVLGADLACGFIIYVVKFFLRGRIRFAGYLTRVMIPEAVCTAVFALLLYRLILFAETKIITEEKRGRRRTWLRD